MIYEMGSDETEMTPVRFLSLMYDKATPRLRVEDLNENSTRYDVAVAAPSDEKLVNYWYAWAAITFLSGMQLYCLLGSCFEQKSPKTAIQPVSDLPDGTGFCFFVVRAVTCLMNATKGSYWSHWMCNFQQFYVVFGFCANIWLNSVVCYQLHTMLAHSNGRRRYKIPTPRQVTGHAMAVYIWAMFLASWGIYETAKFPFHSGAVSGLGCLPVETDEASTIFFWLVFFPLFAGIPLVYVMWASLDVYRRNLLPPQGKRRLLSIYYSRLVVVFVVMWLPSIILGFVLPIKPAYFFGGGAWSHLQGGVSAGVALMKPDIKHAVQRFITCRCCEARENGGFRHSEDFRGSSLSGLDSRRLPGATSLSRGVSNGDSADLEAHKETPTELEAYNETQTELETHKEETSLSDGSNGGNQHCRVDHTGHVTSCKTGKLEKVLHL